MIVILQWLGGTVALLSLLVAVHSLRQNLERERRALAVRLIYDWAAGTDWITSCAIEMAKELDKKQIEDIYDKKATSLDASHHKTIVNILKTDFAENLPSLPDESNANLQITQEQSVFIRFLWVRWLNRLEATLAAWAKGSADLDLMKREFEPLVKSRKAALRALEVVREDLPVVSEFYRQIDEKGRIKVNPPLDIFPWSYFKSLRDR